MGEPAGEGPRDDGGTVGPPAAAEDRGGVGSVALGRGGDEGDGGAVLVNVGGRARRLRRDLGLLGYHAADVAHERLAAVALDVAADVPGRVAGLVGQAAD